VRHVLPGLPSPHPLLRQLPTVYQEEDFLQRFLSALDEVLAPLLLTLDNLPAHLHPRTAPADFLEWVAGWVAAEVPRQHPEGQQRAAVTGAVAQHRLRGTRQGLAAAVRAQTGIEPEIDESGGAAFSTVPGAALPGSAGPWVVVRLRVHEPERFETARLRALLAAELPAHVPYRIDILPPPEVDRP
jgi:phage tail-like protein